MMWCQWGLVRTRMMVSKRPKGGAEGLKIQNIKNLFGIKNLLLKNSKFMLISCFNKSICL
jgi:hypothetical protein